MRAFTTVMTILLHLVSFLVLCDRSGSLVSDMALSLLARAFACSPPAPLIWTFGHFSFVTSIFSFDMCIQHVLHTYYLSKRVEIGRL
ncbi:hypothetical protein HD554DRAFT_861281 [Boletus coccyginus]|nr:hypothetical protein HD554DRAFT_861281 [Boletus coccyginus]